MMETPIYTRLNAYHKKNRISFAMPGHKNLRGLSPDLQLCDVTELASTVDLHHPDECVTRANTLLAECFKSKHSFIMTGGSTAGVQTMINSVLSPGDTLLASSDCHMSVINTCAICGYKLKLIPTEFDSEFLIPTHIKDFEITDDIKAVLITSPNYYGITEDITSIAQKCHDAGIPLLVDEAHGAHFAADERFPKPAIECGADMVCQSAHKTLNALTGAAYLHIGSDRVDLRRVKRTLSAFQSSSPSYPIAASADAARATLSEVRFDDIVDECKKFSDAVEHMTKIRILKNDDPLRLVLCFKGYDTTGFFVDERLSEYYGIDVEMSDYLNIVLIATPWNTHGDFMCLFNALCDITAMLKERSEEVKLSPPPAISGVVEPYLGWYGKTEEIPLCDAAGRTAACTVTAYPPGICIIAAGAVITSEQVEYLKMLEGAGAKITGMTLGRIDVIK